LSKGLTTKQLGESFFCPHRKLLLAKHDCYEDFMNANALGKREDICHGCPDGKLLRVAVAGGVAIPDDEPIRRRKSGKNKKRLPLSEPPTDPTLLHLSAIG